MGTRIMFQLSGFYYRVKIWGPVFRGRQKCKIFECMHPSVLTNEVRQYRRLNN